MGKVLLGVALIRAPGEVAAIVLALAATALLAALGAGELVALVLSVLLTAGMAVLLVLAATVAGRWILTAGQRAVIGALRLAIAAKRLLRRIA